MSRLPIVEEDIFDKENIFLTTETKVINMLQLKKLPIKVKELCKRTERNAVLTRVRHYILSGWPSQDEITPELLSAQKCIDNQGKMHSSRNSDCSMCAPNGDFTAPILNRSINLIAPEESPRTRILKATSFFV